MIEIIELTKRYGTATAVENLSFTIEPGIITGFLGPNGAGKSTTMRLMMGIDYPDAGTVLIDGKRYSELTQPLTAVGALLESRSFHPGRSAVNHLRWLAQTHGIDRKRVDEVLEIAGIASMANRTPATFSLGMAQRLGLAAALLGDPSTLLLDEPMNGLDAEGMTWMRELLPSLAAEGRAVLLSSHLMSEMAQLADRLVVIGRGRLIADTTVTELVSRAGGVRVYVRTADPVSLTDVLAPEADTVEYDHNDGRIIATGLSLREVGDLAAANGLAIHELSGEQPSLEDTFLRLTKDEVEYVGRPS